MSETAKVMNVILVDSDDSEETMLGQILVGEGWQLSLVTAPDASLEFLTNLIEQINGKSFISVKVPGKMKYAVASIEYQRTSDDFFEGLKLYLTHYYSIELRSSTDFTDKPEEFERLTA